MAACELVTLPCFYQMCKFPKARVVTKFWNRRLSCQSKRPVQGYFIWKNTIRKEMQRRVAGRYLPSTKVAIFVSSQLLLTTLQRLFILYFFLVIKFCNLFTHGALRSSKELIETCPCIPNRIGIWQCLKKGENRGTRRKTSWARERTNKKFNPQMASTPGFKRGPYW